MTKEVLAQDYQMGRGVLAKYEIITTDWRGLKLAEPYIGVSIDGSEYMDTRSIARTAKILEAKL